MIARLRAAGLGLLLALPAFVCETAGAGERLPGYGPRVFDGRPSLEQMTELGRKIFFDPGLSSSGRLSCASCHDPAHAFGPPNALSAQRGGRHMDQMGTRAAPTLRYLVTTIPFTDHFIDDEDGHGEDGGPTGALTWDGSVDTPREQALIPLFARHEFGNANPAQLAARVQRSPYAREFEVAFSGPGERVFDEPEHVARWLAAALEVFQQSAPDFYPYTSKYDAVLRHQATLAPEEARGLAVFNDPAKGNCASCHPSSLGSGGAFPRFTDSAYAALGVPRNRALRANRDAAHYDLGLCANGRRGLADRDEFCGRFKTPTLRNVATRRAFFHNGVFHTLREVLEFYARRDTEPARWYPKGRDGQVRKFDDLPARYRGNVIATPPFGRKPGEAPPLDAADIEDLLAFLNTLTDGWAPQAGAATSHAR
ncbi:cytochrome-c peroxidase [Roseateles saccharophilus]|uniref:Cytochrome c peroxidase n=1 Tax=Roseateles saccharophilus TaxID=304 RepID=A0A4R3VF27_ROSSA|nr:cytochrome c peroxidase [Roseateles saccharophilus]MDG0832283.1 cytochrome-c peroxidase [Roseateles saccharophilus]TCV02342.1 cytochrome c peroxidase [Roseateles saccharophilus]